MRKLILKTVISLDSFLEGPNGAMDWFPTDDPSEWELEFKLIEDVDTVLLGRGMYPGYAEYWRRVLAEPAKYSQNQVAFARWADKTRHIVFSRELERADWSNTVIMRDVAKDVPVLKRDVGKSLIVYGGSIFAGTLIDQGLVDEYHFVVQPLALGGGKPMFRDLRQRLTLKRTDVKPLPSGAVWLTYKK